MANIFETIDNKSVVTDDQARELARIHSAGGIVAEKVGNAYLRGLVGRIAEEQPFTLEGAAVVIAGLYPFILEGCTTPDIAPSDSDDRAESRRKALERNRRSNWARTTHVALRNFIKAGGGFPELPDPLTKSTLIKATTALQTHAVSAPVAAGTVATVGAADITAAMRAANAAYRRMLRALTTLQSADPARAESAATTFVDQVTSKFITRAV
jgi:hypothetical protein